MTDSMSINDIAETSAPGPDGDTFKFENVGDTVKGKVVHFDKFVSDNKFKPGQRDEVLAISLEQPDGSILKIYPVTKTNIDGGDPYPDRKAKAIVAGIKAADATTLELNSMLAVKFNEEITIAGFGNPAKGFESEYRPPTASVAVSSLIAEDTTGF